MDYFSGFSGYGGFELGIEAVLPDARCIGFSEIDKWAKGVYRHRFPEHKSYGDATEIIPAGLPDFDLFVGGFPCQAFSIAGNRQGLGDNRGTLFLDVARILHHKRPKWVLLENVRGLLSQGGGQTFASIYRFLTNAGYTVGWQVVNSLQFGVPQNRERVFIIGHLGTERVDWSEIFPLPNAEGTPVQKLPSSTALDANYWKCIDNHGQRTAIVYWKNSSEKWVDEKREFANSLKTQTDLNRQQLIKEDVEHIRMMTPTECERLQGVPDGWTEKGIVDGKLQEISDTQRYKMLGNGVTVPVVSYFIEQMFK
jgi:DNA (cytosine-5)-methyltransferase 1